jgi:hypothetical protein
VRDALEVARTLVMRDVLGLALGCVIAQPRFQPVGLAERERVAVRISLGLDERDADTVRGRFLVRAWRSRAGAVRSRDGVPCQRPRRAARVLLERDNARGQF